MKFYQLLKSNGFQEMVGNTTQQNKKEKKAKEQPRNDNQAEDREQQEKRSSNPQTPKQNKHIDLDKAATEYVKSVSEGLGAY